MYRVSLEGMTWPGLLILRYPYTVLYTSCGVAGTGAARGVGLGDGTGAGVASRGVGLGDASRTDFCLTTNQGTNKSITHNEPPPKVTSSFIIIIRGVALYI
jgi:hypothetical protein